MTPPRRAAILTPPRRAAILTASYYAVIFTALGAHLPYWPVWLADWGLSDGEIATYLGAATFAKVAGTTLLPAIADRFAIRRPMIAGASVLAVLSALVLLAGVESRGALLLITIIGAVAVAPTVPLGEALGVRAAEQHGFAYAPVRAAGSAGFLAANLGVGWALGQAGPDIVLWIMGVGFALVAVLGLVHPGGGAVAGAGMGRASMAEIGRLLRMPVFLIFGLAAALGQGAHAVYYAYSVLDWQVRGIEPGVIGALWAFGVLVETVFMLTLGRAWVTGLGPARALALAAGAGVVRWAAMALGPTGAVLWPLQALHALTFALGHLAAIAFIAAAVPARLVGSAQGIVSGVIGGTVHVGLLFAAAFVVARGGVDAAYAMAAGVALMAAAVASVLAVMWRGGRLLD